jgi:hypothetical protein
VRTARHLSAPLVVTDGNVNDVAARGNGVIGLVELGDVGMPKRLRRCDAFGGIELEQPCQQVQCRLARRGEHLPHSPECIQLSLNRVLEKFNGAKGHR